MPKFNEVHPYPNIKALTKTNIQAYIEKELIEEPPHLKWDVPLLNDLLGLEVEVEQCGRPMADALALWHAVADGSLRNNGVEWRTYAFPCGYAPVVIHNLFSSLKKYNKGYDFSHRTSIHVHMDFRNHELEDLVKLFLVYIPFEKLIFQAISPKRFKNTFCIPLIDVFAGHQGMTSAIQKIQEGNQLDMNDIADITQVFSGKYSAVNPKNLWVRKIERAEHTGSGSIEFRHLHGTDNTELILTWLKIICMMKYFVANNSYKVIENYIKTLNSSSQYQDFATAVFGKYAGFVLPPHKLFELMPIISEGVSSAKELIAHAPLKIEAGDFLGSPLARVLQNNILNKEGANKKKDIAVKKAVARVNWANAAVREAAEFVPQHFVIPPAQDELRWELRPDGLVVEVQPEPVIDPVPPLPPPEDWADAMARRIAERAPVRAPRIRVPR